MKRFFAPALSSASNILSLEDKSEIHHLKNVLRLAQKDPICIFDGKGLEAKGIILFLSDKSVKIQVTETTFLRSRKQILTLACALPKKSKFESIIEKCTELGVDEIIPLETKRTEVRLKPQQRQKKLTRFQAIAINAAKQSKRSTIPRIHEMMNFKQALQKIDNATVSFIGCLCGSRIPLKQALREHAHPKKNLFFFIGPEGDFTSEEMRLAKIAGCIPVDFGKTVLKVDTAAIVAASFTRLFFNN